MAKMKRDEITGNENSAVLRSSSSSNVGGKSYTSNNNTIMPLTTSAAMTVTTRRAALADVTNMRVTRSSAHKSKSVIPAHLTRPSRMSTRVRAVAAAAQMSASSSAVPSSPDVMLVDDVDVMKSTVHTDSELKETTSSSIMDIDTPLKNDPLFCGEYADDIYDYLRERERRNRCTPGYMRRQRDINENMRSILVDWLVEVAAEYRMHTETLYIAVNYIDRFLSEMSVQRGKLQLVGITCMLVASKFEEIFPPVLDEFVYISDGTYTREQILKMEHVVLKVLKFDMAPVSALTFVDRFLVAANADERTRELTYFVCELSLQEEAFIKYLPSAMAAASVVLALYTLQLPHWSETLEHYTEFNLEDLEPIVLLLAGSHNKAPTNALTAVVQKYHSSRHLNIAALAAAQLPIVLY